MLHIRWTQFEVTKIRINFHKKNEVRNFKKWSNADFLSEFCSNDWTKIEYKEQNSKETTWRLLMFEKKKTLPMTPKKESHFNMPRAIPASTGIPVVEPSGHKCCRAGHTGQLYIVRQAVTPVTCPTTYRGLHLHLVTASTGHFIRTDKAVVEVLIHYVVIVT